MKGTFWNLTIHEANMKDPLLRTLNRTLLNLPMKTCFEILDAFKQSCTQTLTRKYYYVNTCGTEQETCSSSREICNSTPRRADIYSKLQYQARVHDAGLLFRSAIILPLTLKRRSSICMLSSSFVHSYLEIFKL